MKAVLVLAVLAIALVALTGVASAAPAAVPIVTGIEAQGTYLGVPTITNLPGLAGYVVGYTYTFFPNGLYTVTVKVGKDVKTYTVKKADITFTKDGKATLIAKGAIYNVPVLVNGIVPSIPADNTIHTLTGPAPSEESILFENGKPVKTITANGETSFDATFYKTIDAALGLNGAQVNPTPVALNSWNLWML
jgi:hypothetical protein